MTTEYSPREGTKAHLALEYFQANPGARLTTGEVAAELDIAPAGLSTQLLPLVDNGLLGADKNGRGYIYFLPKPSPANDGKLQIASWADGDVSVEGGTATESGVLYTREQIQQLVDHVTRPHTDLSGRFNQAHRDAVLASQGGI